MASYNKVILAGNLTRDVDVKYLQSGTAVAEIGLAVNDKVKRNNEWVDETSFIDCVLWGRTAEICAEYCGKGSNILVDGRLKQESWEKDGQKQYKIKVIVENFKMLGSKGDGAKSDKQESRQQEKPKQQQRQQQQDVMDADIPF